MNSSDNVLLKKISEGDRKSFAEFYQKYSSAVFGLSRRILSNKAQAEEATQEIWMKILKHAESFKGSGKNNGEAKSWILQITKYHCLDILKKNPQWQDLADIENTIPIDQDLTDFNQYWDHLKKEAVLKCLEHMPDRQRASLTLFYFEDKSLSTLAIEMDLQANAVKALLFRARQNLLNCVEGRLHE